MPINARAKYKCLQTHARVLACSECCVLCRDTFKRESTIHPSKHSSVRPYVCPSSRMGNGMISQFFFSNKQTNQLIFSYCSAAAAAAGTAVAANGVDVAALMHLATLQRTTVFVCSRCT